MADIDGKGVTRGFYESGGRVDVAASFEKYISESLHNHAMEAASTRDQWRDFDIAFFAAFKDVSVKVLDQVAEDGKVASRWVFQGTQVAEFAGIPSNGRRGFLTATTVDRIVDGRIVEHWIDADFGSFLHQLSA